MSRQPVIVILIAAFAISCGSPHPGALDADTTDDAGADLALVDEAPALMCPVAGHLFCGEKCIDVSFDLDHCGECGNRCTRGKMTCMTGECLCLGAGIMCDGECYDTFTSRTHCGRCSNTCTSAEACVDGDCRPIAEDPNVFGVLVATNEARDQQQDCGVEGTRPAVGPVRLNDQLTVAAQVHAEDMAANRFLEHEGSDGSTPAQRASRAGYMGSSTGENIARGQANAAGAVRAWVDSDGHCRNLMNGNFDQLGVGHATSAMGEPFWVQLFGAQ